MNRDMMQGFELFQPVQIKDALNILDKYEEKSWVYAGGKDSLDWFKDRVMKPDAVVDLNGIDQLKGIRETSNSIDIGTMTTLTEVAENSIIKEAIQVQLI